MSNIKTDKELEDLYSELEGSDIDKPLYMSKIKTPEEWRMERYSHAQEFSDKVLRVLNAEIQAYHEYIMEQKIGELGKLRSDVLTGDSYGCGLIDGINEAIEILKK